MENQSFSRAWQNYQEARNRLLEYFRPRIIGLAKKYLWAKNQEEDVADSVLLSYLEHHARDPSGGKEPDELWELLANITLRHCNKHNKRFSRARKQGRAAGKAEDESTPGFDPAGKEPLPDELAAIQDLFEQCKKKLWGRQQKILGMRLAGMDRKEIADALQVAVPTVDRELNKIKAVLVGLAGDDFS